MKTTVMNLLFLLLSLLLFLFTPALSHAGHITLSTSVTAAVEHNGAKITVSVVNKGDEPAYNIRANLSFASKRHPGNLKDSLGLNEQYAEEFTVPVEFRKPGRYPFSVTVEYTDANLYPFSALSVSYINYRDAANARISCSVLPMSLGESGKVDMVVKNLDSLERSVGIRMMAPNEFMVPSPRSEISLPPGKEKSVSFDIRNISALPGSTYPVFAVLSYEDAEYYYSSIASGTMTVEKHKGAFNIYLKALAAVLIILVLLLLYKIIFKTKK